jgi:hypothetical protein
MGLVMKVTVDVILIISNIISGKIKSIDLFFLTLRHISACAIEQQRRTPSTHIL